MKNYYVYNNLPHAMLLRGGYITLQPQVWNPVKPEDVLGGTFKFEEQCGRLVVQQFDSPPEDVAQPEPTYQHKGKVTMLGQEHQQPESGMTEEDLKVFLKEQNAAPKELSGKTEALGFTTDPDKLPKEVFIEPASTEPQVIQGETVATAPAAPAEEVAGEITAEAPTTTMEIIDTTPVGEVEAKPKKRGGKTEPLKSV